MMRSRSFKILLVLAGGLLLLVFGVGGGFGTKTNRSRLNDVPLAFFAHRGGDAVFPENSLEGVQHALTLGYAGVEIDIHTTKDRVLVLFHDDSCQRQLGLDGLVSEHSLQELRMQPLCRHGVPTTSRIPTLDEVLRRVGDSLIIYLDIKVTELDQADSLAGLIARHYVQENILVASSSIRFLTYLEFHHPELNTVLEGFDKGEEWTWRLFPTNFRPDFLSSFAFEVDSAHTAWLYAHQLLANKLVYGVDSLNFQRLRSLGITRFIVDDGQVRIQR